MKEKTVLETYEEKRDWVKVFNLTSDLFACKVFEDVGACQELCEILLRERPVVLQSVRTQYVIRNLETHSMELDILAERDNGDMIGIEIQMYEETAPFKRTRYYLSGIDMSILEKGKDYDKLPAVTMVYLTKEDIIGDGKGCCVIERMISCQGNISDNGDKTENTKKICNGVRERYYNLEYCTGDDQIDELLTYFKDSDPYYRSETFPRIVQRVKYFKIQREGVNVMCEIADRIRNEGMLEGMTKAVIELLEDLGQVPQQIAELIRSEDDLGVLSRWHKAAARATSITDQERAEAAVFAVLRMDSTNDPKVIEDRIRALLAEEFGVEKGAFHIMLQLTLIGEELIEEYAAWGLTQAKDGFWMYQEEKIRTYEDKMLGSYQSREEGTVDISVQRDALGEITSISVWRQGDPEFDDRTRKMLKNLQGRSATLDVHAVDSDNKEVDIEIQRSDSGAGAKRARHNSSLLDTHILKPGEDTEDIPDSYVIFITENDVMKGNQPIYSVERYVTIGKEKVLFNDGSHILYVNGKYRGDDEIGKLMHVFSCTNPDDMNYDALARRARYFKQDEKGVATMCKIMEDMRNEAAQKAEQDKAKKTAVRLIKLGKMSLEEIAEATELTLDVVKELENQSMQSA